MATVACDHCIYVASGHIYRKKKGINLNSTLETLRSISLWSWGGWMCVYEIENFERSRSPPDFVWLTSVEGPEVPESSDDPKCFESNVNAPSRKTNNGDGQIQPFDSWATPPLGQNEGNLGLIPPSEHFPDSCSLSARAHVASTGPRNRIPPASQPFHAQIPAVFFLFRPNPAIKSEF